MSINLTGKRVRLRLMTPEDTELIIKWRNNPRVRQNFIYQRPFTREGHQRWIDTMINTKEAVQFIVEEAETFRPVGSVYFRDISREHQKAEYGIFIGEDDAVGRGLGSETASLAVRYGFEVLKLHKIVLRVFADNAGAIRSYEKAGFQKEAYLKDEVCIDGVFRDMILMAVIHPGK